MSDPITRVAKRQWLIDRYTEMLAEAGDRNAETRAVRLVEEAETLGWTPPRDLTEKPPLRPDRPADPDGPGRREFREARAALAARRTP